MCCSAAVPLHSQQAQAFPTLKEATAAALAQHTQSTDATSLPAYAAVPDLRANDVLLNAFPAVSP